MISTEEQADIAARIRELYELWKTEFANGFIVQETSNGKTN